MSILFYCNEATGSWLVVLKVLLLLLIMLLQLIIIKTGKRSTNVFFQKARPRYSKQSTNLLFSVCWTRYLPFFNIMELNGTRIVLLKAWKMKKLQNKNEKLSCNVSKVPGIKKQKSTNLILFGFMYVSTDLHPPSRLNLPSTCDERVVHVRDRI